MFTFDQKLLPFTASTSLLLLHLTFHKVIALVDEPIGRNSKTQIKFVY